MKTNIINNFDLDNGLQKTLRTASDNAEVIFLKDGKKYGLIFGCGQQEEGYYMSTVLLENCISDRITAGQLEYILKCQVSEALDEKYGYNFNWDDLSEDEIVEIEEEINNGEGISLQYVAFFCYDTEEEAHSNEDFWEYTDEAYYPKNTTLTEDGKVLVELEL